MLPVYGIHKSSVWLVEAERSSSTVAHTQQKKQRKQTPATMRTTVSSSLLLILMGCMFFGSNAFVVTTPPSRMQWSATSRASSSRGGDATWTPVVDQSNIVPRVDVAPSPTEDEKKSPVVDQEGEILGTAATILDAPSPPRMAASSVLAEEALACYPYEFRSDDSTKKRTIMDITRKQALTAFHELARLYGPERSVELIKGQPLVLASANVGDFEASYKVWCDVFGVGPTQAMVARNPGLLLVKPKMAEADAFGAMGWSYVLWATRPIASKLALGGYLFYAYDSAFNSAEGLPEWILHASDGL